MVRIWIYGDGDDGHYRLSSANTNRKIWLGAWMCTAHGGYQLSTACNVENNVPIVCGTQVHCVLYISSQVSSCSTRWICMDAFSLGPHPQSVLLISSCWCSNFNNPWVIQSSSALIECWMFKRKIQVPIKSSNAIECLWNQMKANFYIRANLLSCT